MRFFNYHFGNFKISNFFVIFYFICDLLIIKLAAAIIVCKNNFLDIKQTKMRIGLLRARNLASKPVTDEQICLVAANLLRNKQYKNAIVQCDKLNNKNDFKAFQIKTECLFELKMYLQALDLIENFLKSNEVKRSFKEIVIQDESLLEKFYKIAYLNEQTNDYVSALEYYKKLEQLFNDPEQKAVYFKIKCLFRMKIYDEALKCAIESLKKYPQNNLLNKLKIKIELISQLDRGNYVPALANFESLIESFPHLLGNFIERANFLLFDLKNYKDAIQIYDKVLNLFPNDKDCLFGKAESLFNLNYVTESNKLYLKLIEMDQNNAKYCLGYGRTLFEKTRKNDLVPRLQFKQQEFPIDNWSINQLKIKDYKIAVRFLKQAISQFPFEQTYLDECEQFLISKISRNENSTVNSLIKQKGNLKFRIKMNFAYLFL